ncbi:hypothetical protein DPMN_132064 [Dreissena polymorpha]|uniref:Uncharacterized protein n=1 Tax=Dreissena polymorpha TaxID=45954 RepID=A0A9D4J8J2_DREPO|nr:hypothetical protein DPMN_132064 [Dreissena polymorpha]
MNGLVLCRDRIVVWQLILALNILGNEAADSLVTEGATKEHYDETNQLRPS